MRRSGRAEPLPMGASRSPNDQARGSLPGPTTSQHSLDLYESVTLATSPHPRRSNQHLLYPHFPCEHCGKDYSTLHHLEAHQRGSCNVSKRKMSDLLASTKEFWEAKKRRRLDQKLLQNVDGQGTQIVEGILPVVRNNLLHICRAFGSNYS
jgi:hypothetical protein